MNLRTAAALGGLIVFTLFGCKPAEVALPQTEPLPVATISVHAADEPRWIEMLGQAEGGGEVEVRAQVSGILKRFNYQEGDLVKAGDVLFEIEDAPFKARLDAARSTRLQYADELAQAERELKRTSTLYKSGAASRKDYDDAVSTRNQKKFQFEQAAADEKDAAISLNWTKVLAPASGFASRANLNPGSLVDASTSVLATITQHDDIRVTFAPSDRDLGEAKISLDSAVRVFTKNGRELPAKLDYVSQSLDPSVGTRLMRASLKPDQPVIPGEFVTVRLMTGVDKHAYRVPQRAILQRPDGTYAVYIVKDDKALRQTVTVGLWEGKDWIVLSGLEDGDRVITNQLLRIQDGMPVRLAESTAQSNKITAQ